MADKISSRDLELAQLLQALLEISQTDSWRLWRAYIASLYEAATVEMEEAKNFYEFVEARAIVRSLRQQLEFVPDMIRQTEVLKKTPNVEE